MKGLVSDTNLTAIGNAIREKTGKTAKIKVSSMAEEIQGITCKRMHEEDIAEKMFKGGITLSVSLVTNDEIEITTKAGETILASKYF